MSQLILQSDFPTLSPNDKIESAVALIKMSGLDGLPIVENDKLIGTLILADIDMLQKQSPEASRLSELQIPPPFSIHKDAHPYHAVKLFSKINRTFLPAIDAENRYQGLILHKQLVETLSRIFSLHHIEQLLELEIPAGGFKLSELIKLLEQNETRVISLSVTPSIDTPESNIITLNIESRDAFRLQKTLERYGYHISYNSHVSENPIDDTSFRAQELLRYLEI